MIDNFLSSLELFPSILSAAGIEKPADLILDGFNMLPVLTGENPNLVRREMFWAWRDQYAARLNDWKLVYNGAQEELFDLSKDLSEVNNLRDQLPAEWKEVSAHFTAWQAEMERAEARGPFRDF